MNKIKCLLRDWTYGDSRTGDWGTDFVFFIDGKEYWLPFNDLYNISSVLNGIMANVGGAVVFEDPDCELVELTAKEYKYRLAQLENGSTLHETERLERPKKVG